MSTTSTMHVPNDDEWELARAVDTYKRKHGLIVIPWSTVFQIMVSLGYRKVAPPEPMPQGGRRERKARAPEASEGRSQGRHQGGDAPPATG